MELGDIVTYRKRAYYLRGLDPMSVDDRRADLEDVRTGVRISAAFAEIEEGAPPSGPKGNRRLEEV